MVLVRLRRPSGSSVHSMFGLPPSVNAESKGTNCSAPGSHIMTGDTNGASFLKNAQTKAPTRLALSGLNVLLERTQPRLDCAVGQSSRQFDFPAGRSPPPRADLGTCLGTADAPLSLYALPSSLLSSSDNGKQERCSVVDLCSCLDGGHTLHRRADFQGDLAVEARRVSPHVAFELFCSRPCRWPWLCGATLGRHLIWSWWRRGQARG